MEPVQHVRNKVKMLVEEYNVKMQSGIDLCMCCPKNAKMVLELYQWMNPFVSTEDFLVSKINKKIKVVEIHTKRANTFEKFKVDIANVQTKQDFVKFANETDFNFLKDFARVLNDLKTMPENKRKQTIEHVRDFEITPGYNKLNLLKITNMTVACLKRRPDVSFQFPNTLEEMALSEIPIPQDKHVFVGDVESIRFPHLCYLVEHMDMFKSVMFVTHAASIDHCLFFDFSNAAIKSGIMQETTMRTDYEYCLKKAREKNIAKSKTLNRWKPKGKTVIMSSFKQHNACKTRLRDLKKLTKMKKDKRKSMFMSRLCESYKIHLVAKHAESHLTKKKMTTFVCMQRDERDLNVFSCFCESKNMLID